MLSGGVLNLGSGELGLGELELVRPITEEEAIAKATAFLNDKEKIKAAQNAIANGVDRMKDLAWGAIKVLNGFVSDTEKAAAVRDLVLLYRTEANGGKRGDVIGEFPGIKLKPVWGKDLIIEGNIGIADEDLEAFADEIHDKILRGCDSTGKDTQKGYGGDLMRKHFYNFSISTALKNMEEEYQQFADVVSRSIYASNIDAGGVGAESNKAAVFSAVLGARNADGLYEGGSFGVEGGKLKGGVSDAVVARAKEEAAKATEQKQKIDDALDKLRKARAELNARQNEVDFKTGLAQGALVRIEEEISALVDIDPAEAQAEARAMMVELFMSMCNFCILLQNKLHSSLHFANNMIGALEVAYGVKKDG